jgi:peptidoglycan biosynthesis protein MviN/MurJ (putative lipid II flippase)
LTTVTIGYGVAAFSLLSAFFHLLVATVARRTYERGVARQQNPFRWIEYSFSATLMIVLITMLLGDYDVGALIGVAGANVSMILFGWLMERQNGPDGKIDWYPFVFGCVAGLVPWIVILTYFQGALGNADEAVPAWVWGIMASVFVLFNCFAVNQFLQYRRFGPWRRYVFGEGTYIVLSLVAKTALMWQVYFGTVR